MGRRSFGITLGAAAIGLALPQPAASIDWGKLFGDVVSGGGSDALSDGDIVAGLTEALARGSETAIRSLGQTDGYFSNPAVKIPMPGALASVESALRTVGLARYADEFVLTMNRAAEAAVSEATDILGDAIRHMTWQDARGILSGPDDAATQYLRRVGETRIESRMHPIVADATTSSGTASAYKTLMDKAGIAGRLMGADAFDLDSYVTNKATDGLFLQIAAEEKRIRKDPVARSTDILKKVFGSG